MRRRRHVDGGFYRVLLRRVDGYPTGQRSPNRLTYGRIWVDDNQHGDASVHEESGHCREHHQGRRTGDGHPVEVDDDRLWMISRAFEGRRSSVWRRSEVEHAVQIDI